MRYIQRKTIIGDPQTLITSVPYISNLFYDLADVAPSKSMPENWFRTEVAAVWTSIGGHDGGEREAWS
jgi:hypothetical protein